MEKLDKIEMRDLFKTYKLFKKSIKNEIINNPTDLEKNTSNLVKKIRDYVQSETDIITNPFLLKYRQGDLNYENDYYTKSGKIVVSLFVYIIQDLNNKYKKADVSTKEKIEKFVKEFAKELLFDNFLDIIDISEDRYIEFNYKDNKYKYEISQKTISQGLKDRKIDEKIISVIEKTIKEEISKLNDTIEKNIEERNKEYREKLNELKTLKEFREKTLKEFRNTLKEFRNTLSNK